jgi:hypothetical protein
VVPAEYGDGQTKLATIARIPRSMVPNWSMSFTPDHLHLGRRGIIGHVPIPADASAHDESFPVVRIHVQEPVDQLKHPLLVAGQRSRHVFQKVHHVIALHGAGDSVQAFEEGPVFADL